MIHENHRGYKELLVGEGKTIGVAKVSTQIKFEMDEHGSTVHMKLLRILESLNLHMKTSFCPLTLRMLLERLHST